MTYLTKDYLHTQTGSFLVSELKSFEILNQQTILSFVDGRKHVCLELFPTSIIQSLRNRLDTLSEKSIEQDHNVQLRNAFDVYGNKNDLEEFAIKLKSLDIKQPMFVQYFEQSSKLFLLIDHSLQTLSSLHEKVTVSLANKSSIYQTEIGSFSTFKYNTLEDKTSIVYPVILDFMKDADIQKFTEDIFSKFEPKNLFIQMIAGDWGEAILYVSFLGQKELSEQDRTTLLQMWCSSKVTFYPSLTLKHLDYNDGRTISDIRNFIYNTMPIVKQKDIPFLPELADDEITITISNQFSKMDVWELIGQKISNKFPNARMFLLEAPMQSKKLYVTIKQKSDISIFDFEQLLTDLGMNVKQFNIGVDTNPPRNPKEPIKFRYSTI